MRFIPALACAAALSLPALAHNVWLEPDAGGGYLVQFGGHEGVLETFRPDKLKSVQAFDARGRSIAEPDEIPEDCGVLVLQGERLNVARAAPRPARAALPFGVWMALAKATPVASTDDDAQGLLSDS